MLERKINSICYYAVHELVIMFNMLMEHVPGKLDPNDNSLNLQRTRKLQLWQLDKLEIQGGSVKDTLIMR